MKQESEQATQDVHKEPYEAPRLEIIKLEMEQPVLTGSFDDWEPERWR